LLRVLVFSHEFPPVGGGAGVVAAQVCAELSQHDCEVSLLTKDVHGESVKCDVNLIKPRVVKKSCWPLAFLGKVKHHNYDLIVLNDPGAIYVAGISFSTEALRKSVCFLHGSEPENIIRNSNLIKKLTFFRFFYNRALIKCLFIASPSSYMRRKFLENTASNLLNNKIETIYYGVDEQLFFYDRCVDVRKEMALGDSFVFLTVSRIEKKKGFDKKLKVFCEALRKKSNIIWLIVGDGSYLSEFYKKVIDSEAVNNVIFIGRVPRDRLRYYYSAADVFWLLSEFEESFGLVYIEAQLCGLPSIGYDRYGVSEAISQNDGGMLIKNAEELVFKLNEIVELRNRNNKLRNFALKFSVKSCAIRLLKHFHSRMKGFGI